MMKAIIKTKKEYGFVSLEETNKPEKIKSNEVLVQVNSPVYTVQDLQDRKQTTGSFVSVRRC